MAQRPPQDGRWLPSHSRDFVSISSSRWQSSPSTQSTMAPMPPAPQHPVPQMQGAFEESMRETMTEADEEAANNPYLDADKYQRRKLLLEGAKYERTVAGRWLQKHGENFHPLWKLVAQISFGMHLLQMGLARSDADVIHILQTHVDEIDGFLERTTEDFELAQQDIEDRIKHLRTPLDHGDVFDTMLSDREFRAAIVDGNEKIEHILTRTTVAMKDSLKDVQKGLDGTKQLASFLKDIDRKWPNKSEEHAAVYSAMIGNTEGWSEAYKSLQQTGSDLGLCLAQLEGIVSEIQRRAGVASRRNLPNQRQSNSLVPSPAVQTPPPGMSSTPTLLASHTQAHQQDDRGMAGPRKYLPEEPSQRIARSKPSKSKQVIELPADMRIDRKSMQASVRNSISATTRSSVPSQITEVQSNESYLDDQESYQDSNVAEESRWEELEVDQRQGFFQDRRYEAGPPVIPEPPQFNSNTLGTFLAPSSDTGSLDARSAQSNGQSRAVSHVRNPSSLSSGEPLAAREEEDVVNRAHPIFQDIRVRDVLQAIAPQEQPPKEPMTRTSADSFSSSAHKDPFRDSSQSDGPNAFSSISPVGDPNRDSNNTMATPISLGPSTVLPIGEKRAMSPMVPPINTNFGEKGTVGQGKGSPPSPRLEDLTSATIAGPDLGDPFAAPASPYEQSRYPETGGRLAQRSNDSNQVGGRSRRDHSRTVSRVKPEPLHISTTTTTTTTTTAHPGPGQSRVTTTSSPSIAHSAPVITHTHLQPQLYSPRQPSPGSPAMPTAYRNLSPFPSTSSRGSRRPSFPVQDLATQVDDSQTNRRSGIKKFFNVKRGGRNNSVGNF